MIIVLSGYMGSGKSLIGKKLAEKLNWTYLDLDEEIEKKQNMLIADVFSEKGEIFFRKTENEVLKSCLNTKENKIISLGGGTPCYGNNLNLIKENPNTTMIYLKVDVQTLLNRLQSQRHHRPLISHLEDEEKLDEFIRKHLFERQYYYMQSDLVIDASSANPDEIAEEILQSLKIKK